jgi:hypothetical protein
MMFQTNLLWQNDERWATTTLGYGPQTLQDWGCLTTVLTMVVNGYGYNETPVTVSQKMVAIGAFHGSAINAFRIGEAFPGVAIANLINCERTPAPLADIDAELTAGRPVLACVDQSPAAGIQDHWILLYARENDEYLMLDPWRYPEDVPGQPNYLTRRYKNSGGTPEAEITQVLFLQISSRVRPTGPFPEANFSPLMPSAAQPPLVTNFVPLRSTSDGLALRGAPGVSAPLLRRFPAGASFKSLEDDYTTLQKVGVEGQWINVQAPGEDQGFVAAWYVIADTSTAPAPAIRRVTVTGDHLAFRSQPVIAEDNVISYFALDTELTVIDPQASQKIGVANQWLQIKDSTGREGYVAAWYVK